MSLYKMKVDLTSTPIHSWYPEPVNNDELSIILQKKIEMESIYHGKGSAVIFDFNITVNNNTVSNVVLVP